MINTLIKKVRTSRYYENLKKNKVLRALKDKYDQNVYMNKSNNLKKYGVEALLLLKESFSQIDKTYWLDYGTLLGAIREKDFIGHDKDIDIGTFDFSDEEKLKLQEILFSKGFKKYKQYELAGKIIEESYDYNGVHIDIFYYHQLDDEKIWCYFCEIGFDMSFENYPTYQLAKGYRINKVVSRFSGLTEYEFKGDKFYIPSNYHEYLVDNYLESYMEINPDWPGDGAKNIFPVNNDDVLVKEFI
jgi:LicD family